METSATGDSCSAACDDILAVDVLRASPHDRDGEVDNGWAGSTIDFRFHAANHEEQLPMLPELDVDLWPVEASGSSRSEQCRADLEAGALAEDSRRGQRCADLEAGALAEKLVQDACRRADEIEASYGLEREESVMWSECIVPAPHAPISMNTPAAGVPVTVDDDICLHHRRASAAVGQPSELSSSSVISWAGQASGSPAAGAGQRERTSTMPSRHKLDAIDMEEVLDQVAREPEITINADCCVCMELPKSNVFLPCGHMCVCQQCADNIMAASKECPMCRRASTHSLYMRASEHTEYASQKRRRKDTVANIESSEGSTGHASLDNDHTWHTTSDDRSSSDISSQLRSLEFEAYLLRHHLTRRLNSHAEQNEGGDA